MQGAATAHRCLPACSALGLPDIAIAQDWHVAIKPHEGKQTAELMSRSPSLALADSAGNTTGGHHRGQALSMRYTCQKGSRLAPE